MKTVILKLFRDEANGEYGVAHSNAVDRGFNAFWSGVGIFHDVFEHHHEDTHKYFKGDYAFNVAGEMMASGAMYYYSNELGVYNRRLDSFKGWERSVVESGYDSWVDLLNGYGGYGDFGLTLESRIPYQRPVGSFDSYIEDGWLQLQSYEPIDRDEQQDYNDALDCKASITKRKFFDLYRYGFRYAQRFVPDNYENQATLSEFINFWNDITKKVDAETLYSFVDSIQFNISKAKSIVSVKAYLVLRSGTKKRIRSIDDFDPYDDLMEDY